MSYTITINDIDRTTCILNQTVKIADEAKEAPSTMDCEFLNRDSGTDIALNDEIVVTLDDVIIFGGYVLSMTPSRMGSVASWNISCVDYSRDLDRRLVVESYQNKTDHYIISDIISRYCPNTGITAVNLTGTPITIKQISFNYVIPSECFSRLADLTGRSWYLDYSKDIHYFPLTTTSAPFDIDSDETRFSNLTIKKDNSQIRNRIYVRGGTYLSAETTYAIVADGEQTMFVLPEKPSEITITEDVTSKTCGIKNINDFTEFDYLMNYQEKYIETETAPSADTVITVAYKYFIPVLVAVEDKTSIDSIGVFEYAIFDNTIRDLQQARDRAAAELVDFASTIIDGKFSTYTNGFRAGQSINIEDTVLGIDDDYYIQSVRASSLGGGTFNYEVIIGSANKIGIIKFLVKMLEQDKNALNISQEETVDELFEVADASVVITESAPDLDTTDAPPFEWGSFKWNFAEWTAG